MTLDDVLTAMWSGPRGPQALILRELAVNARTDAAMRERIGPVREQFSRRATEIAGARGPRSGAAADAEQFRYLPVHRAEWCDIRTVANTALGAGGGCDDAIASHDDECRVHDYSTSLFGGQSRHRVFLPLNTRAFLRPCCARPRLWSIDQSRRSHAPFRPEGRGHPCVEGGPRSGWRGPVGGIASRLRGPAPPSSWSVDPIVARGGGRVRRRRLASLRIGQPTSSCKPNLAPDVCIWACPVGGGPTMSARPAGGAGMSGRGDTT